VTVRELCKTRCLHGVKDGVKLLARVCSRHNFEEMENEC